MHNNIERRLSIKKKTRQNQGLSGDKTEESRMACLEEGTEDVLSV